MAQEGLDWDVPLSIELVVRVRAKCETYSQRIMPYERETKILRSYIHDKRSMTHNLTLFYIVYIISAFLTSKKATVYVPKHPTLNLVSGLPNGPLR